MTTVVGKALPKIDAPDKVTGKARYVADIHFPDLLEGKVLRSTQAHAKILRLDTSKAERLPGVKAVVTAQDAPAGVLTGPSVKDRPLFAAEKVRFYGEAIAAVAAVSPEIAEEALDLIEVEYEPLPALFDPFEAMEPSALLVHENSGAYAPSSTASQRERNVLNQSYIVRGDVEKAFAEADYVLEERYTTQPVHHGYIETRETIAKLEPNGRLTVWCSTQGPFGMRQSIAEALKIPVSKVRVTGATVGGAFGGKMFLALEAICCLLAMKSGHPVKLSMTREEEFIGGELRHPAYVDLKSAVSPDGKITALQGRFVIDSGAYASWAPMVVTRFADLQGPYNIPNVKLEGCSVYTNNVVSGMHRAPGAPQASFAIESHIDTIARHLKLDPIELRLLNGVEGGDLSPTGAILRNVAFKETLRRTAEWVRQNPKPEPSPGKLVGRGFASGQWATQAGRGAGPQASSCTLRMNEDGTLVLATGAMDLGTGMNTILAQIAAEGLGLGLEDVTVIAADTDTTPYESGSGGSLGTHRAGNTVRLAAEALRRQVLKFAAERLEANVADLDIAEKKVFVKGSPDKSITLQALAAAAQTSRIGPVLATSTEVRDELIPNMPRDEADAPTYSTHVVDLEVDPATGQVRVLNYHAVQDVGFALNPATVQGQIEGGIYSSLGLALTEQVALDKKVGRPLNDSFLDYKMPTALDTPPISEELVEEASAFGPYGAKGVGEPPVIPVAAAVANAVFDATGIRIRDLPITAEKIVLGMRHQARQGGFTPARAS